MEGIPAPSLFCMQRVAQNLIYLPCPRVVVAACLLSANEMRLSPVCRWLSF